MCAINYLLVAMIKTKFIETGLTFDDVLLVPSFSEVLPSDVELLSKFSRNLSLKVPVVSAAMDTVTESKMAIAMAQEGGIGVIHKNLTIKQQAEKIRKVKRSESGMILDPVTLTKKRKVKDALKCMKELRNWLRMYKDPTLTYFLTQ